MYNKRKHSDQFSAALQITQCCERDRVMALPKKGSRRIDVDGVEYRWVIRHKPTYTEAIGQANLRAVVELYENPLSVLKIGFMLPRNDSWLTNSKVEVGPRHIQMAIQKALISGWEPHIKGNNHELRCNAT